MNFQQRLVSIMVRKDLTFETVADMFGVGPGTVERWAEGSASPMKLTRANVITELEKL